MPVSVSRPGLSTLTSQVCVPPAPISGGDGEKLGPKNVPITSVSPGASFISHAEPVVGFSLSVTVILSPTLARIVVPLAVAVYTLAPGLGDAEAPPLEPPQATRLPAASSANSANSAAPATILCFATAPPITRRPSIFVPFETRHVCHAFVARVSSRKGNYLLPFSRPPPLVCHGRCTHPFRCDRRRRRPCRHLRRARTRAPRRHPGAARGARPRHQPPRLPGAQDRRVRRL